MAGQQKLCKSHKHNKEDNYQMSLTVDAGTRNLDQDDADTPWATPVAGRKQQQHEILFTIHNAQGIVLGNNVKFTSCNFD